MRIVLLSTRYDEDFALVLFEDEDMYSVVETSQIREPHYAYNQTVNVLWGKGKDAEYFPAKLILCGTQAYHACALAKIYVTTCFTVV